MAKKEKPRTYPVGARGEVKLPEDAMAALDLNPGDEVTIFVDTRRKQVRIERYVDDPWAEALKPKEEKGFEDLMGEQRDREAQAKKLFEERLKKAKPEKRKPEEDPDLWR